ncbi:penicillin acylase family protein [Microvirga sp. STR05]|uniref:Penicillin acylase family protein n=1 Tax=Hymenobacter duratus TaxID=2771356 RepID=A0ABR8JD97_9BACT|nr:penicillin acylase family protein [Hymenobacter duratus]MBD2713720.1 penicillin acylase family protein [Hymenobacter duratus]MBR7948622.1 penicillin acylase family protein [Microvirga sp. STR05]
MLRYVRAVLALVTALSLTWVLNTRQGEVPPFGKFLSPFRGFWRNAEAADALPTQQTLRLPGLQQPVQVRFDDKRVPHIFAQNDHDLYYTQGYLTAQDRLWQMDFVTHVAGGRLSEIVGPARLETDRFFRRMGLSFGARKSLEVMMADPTTRTVLTSYSAGVNAYIQSLTPASLPFEYKLLDYKPEPWAPLKCALLLKYMAFDLSGRSDDLRLSNALRKYGPAVVKDLFPGYPTREDPIVPVGTPLDFTPEQVPPTPASFEAAMSNSTPQREPDPELGSNNFAVSGAKSASGFPLLANDPHLQLNLPSIWYQVQLSAPGLNVYGVTIPGAPTVIIGFNQEVAWGVTNVGADVLDWYQLKFKDDTRREYWHDGRWKPVRRVVEHIKVRGQPDRLDTVLYTHHGPVVYDKQEKPFLPQTPIRHAMRWTAHEGANEVLAFYRLNRARTYTDYTTALTTYGSPAQNFIFASQQNDIAIWPNGRLPLKWPNQGKFVLDGTDPAYDWQGWIPQAQNPHVKNPARGFVSSANQFSAGQDYPYYLGWDFASWERGHRINQRLARMTRVTPDSLRHLQNDNLGMNAQLMLPRLLALVPDAQLTPAERRAYDELRRWHYSYDAAAIAPGVFELWYNNLVKRLWADDFGLAATGLEMRNPPRDRTNNLILREPNSPWIDDRRTPERETLPQLALASFRFAADSLTRKFGPLSEKWAWKNQKSTDILHLAQLPGFGHMDLDCGGGAGIVNATSERNGPSWRMVVALGPRVRAYGVFPGGQSGNPGSPAYDDLLETWRVGQLNELLFLRSADEPTSRVRAAWTLER